MTYSLSSNSIFALSLCGAVSMATAGPPKVECPSEIPPSAIRVDMQGWKPYIQFPLYLSSAGISAGPPESLAVLRGEPLNKKGQLQSTRFEFGDMGFEQGKWLDCGYGTDSQITISRRLDDSLKECTVTYMKSKRSDKQNLKIECK